MREILAQKSFSSVLEPVKVVKFSFFNFLHFHVLHFGGLYLPWLLGNCIENWYMSSLGPRLLAIKRGGMTKEIKVSKGEFFQWGHFSNIWEPQTLSRLGAPRLKLGMIWPLVGTNPIWEGQILESPGSAIDMHKRDTKEIPKIWLFHIKQILCSDHLTYRNELGLFGKREKFPATFVNEIFGLHDLFKCYVQQKSG